MLKNKYRVTCFILLGFLSSALITSSLLEARAQESLIKTEGTVRSIKTPSYAATVDAQGALPSFKIGDQEFFKAEEGIPHGAYLYQDGPVWLPEIEQIAADTILAKSTKAAVRYAFNGDSVTITVSNQTEKGMTYYIVFDPEVDAVIDNAGNAHHPFVNQGGQQATSWFIGKNKLKIEGGDILSGPWNEKFQLWSLNLEPKKLAL